MNDDDIVISDDGRTAGYSTKKDPHKPSSKSGDKTKITWWILYNGTQLTIYQSDQNNSTAKVISQYNATSGMKGLQAPTDKNLRAEDGGGPVPPGRYRVNLKLDMVSRIARYNKKTFETIPGEGIEIIDWSTAQDKDDWYAPSGWGQWRARLDKIKTNTSRNFFYIHDSYKGETHGCVETETNLYYDLAKYKYQGNEYIDVVIKYAGASTLGATLKDPRPWEIKKRIDKDKVPRPIAADVFPDLNKVQEIIKSAKK